MILVGTLLGSSYARYRQAKPKNFTAVLDEVFAEQRVLDAPLVNNAGSELLFAQDAKQGVAVFLMELATLKQTHICETDTEDNKGKRTFRLIGWSPDDRYLALSAMMLNTNQNKRVQQLIICDGITGAKGGLFEIAKNPQSCAWLSSNSIVILTDSHKLMLYTLEVSGNLVHEKAKPVQLRVLSNAGAYGMVRVSDNTLAYIDKDNLWALDTSIFQAKQLTHLAGAKLEWLDYSQATGKYLFCMSPSGNVTNRFVYEFLPGETNEPVQLTHDYSFKGQWLKDKTGMAYVCTTGDKSFLAIESEDINISTNLFTGGSIRSYSISPKRDAIYAVASLRYKAQSIWEYNIFDKTIRNVLRGGERENTFSQIVKPISASTTNKNGETVEYFTVPPAKLVKNKKYPAVLDLYPINRYDQNVQVLANAGIYYSTATRLGLTDWQQVAKPEDILAVYNELLKNPNIDASRIYIYGRSFSTGAVTEMVNDYPDLWRGMILFSPVSFPIIPAKATKYPSIFIAEGDKDEDQLQEHCNHLWQDACNRLVPARIHFEHAGHGFTEENYKTSYAILTEFIQAGY